MILRLVPPETCEQTSLTGPAATGRPLRAMFPCEMARYIAGFQPEARKYGGFFGFSARRFSTPPGQIPTDPAGQAIQHRAPGGHPLAGAGRAAGAAIRGGGAAIRGGGG